MKYTTSVNPSPAGTLVLCVSIIQVPPSVDGLVIYLISKSILMPPEQSGCIEGFAVLLDGIHFTQPCHRACTPESDTALVNSSSALEFGLDVGSADQLETKEFASFVCT